MPSLNFGTNAQVYTYLLWLVSHCKHVANQAEAYLLHIPFFKYATECHGKLGCRPLTPQILIHILSPTMVVPS